MQNFVNFNYYPNVSQYNQLPDPGQNEPFNKATQPSDKPVISKHIFAVDSRQRNYDKYPEANEYVIPIPDRYRNVTAIELKAAMLPRTEYNVNSSNKHMDFCIGSFINKITTVGSAYIIKDGKPYVPATNVRLNIDAPISGIQAIVEIDIDSQSNIVHNSYNIINPGKGYIQSKPPRISIGDFSDFNIEIGFHYTGELREGQYVIGGNPQFTDNATNTVLQSWTPSNLLCEIENSLSYSILKDVPTGLQHCFTRKPWISENTVPAPPESYLDDRPLLFTSRLMSQYPTLDTYENFTQNTVNNCETNSCKFNRIYLSNCLIFTADILPAGNTFFDSNFIYNILLHKEITGSGSPTSYILYFSFYHQ